MIWQTINALCWQHCYHIRELGNRMARPILPEVRVYLIQLSLCTFLILKNNTLRVSLDIMNLFTPHLGINPFAPFIFTSTFVNNFSIKVNRHHVLRSWFFPWISKPEPIIGFFNLKWFIISLRDKNAIKQIKCNFFK